MRVSDAADPQWPTQESCTQQAICRTASQGLTDAVLKVAATLNTLLVSTVFLARPKINCFFNRYFTASKS